MLMAFFLIVGVFPISVFADTSLGKVHVIVENTTADGSTGTWSAGTDPWEGVKLDTWIDIESGDTGFTALKRAVEQAGLTITASGDYVTEIAGLKADNINYYGWMVMYNDWFTNQTLGYYNVSDGDEVHAMYSLTFGSDIGGSSANNTKTLKALAVTGGTLTPNFNQNRTAYELALGEGVQSAKLSLLPTAFNKNFQVRIYKGKTYSSGDDGYKRGTEITVAPGDTLLVVVGDPAWDSMNNSLNNDGSGAESVPAGIYTISVVDVAETPDVTFDSFFTALDGIATVTNDATYPWEVTEDETALVSTNAKNGSTNPGITLTFSKAAKLTFKYKASTEERWDYLKITKNNTLLNGNEASKFSGNMTEFKEYSVEADVGDVIVLSYYKDYSGEANDDCVWLKDFSASLATTLTLHANDGSDETAEQGVFGTSAIKSNPFKREKLRFDGWATSPDGEVVYKDGDSITLTENSDLYAVWTSLWYLTFPSMPEGAKITVSQDGKEIAPVSDGKWLLPDGDYTFSASLFGYVPVKDKAVAISGADLASAETLTMSEHFTLSFTTNVENATIEVKNSNGTVMNAENGVYSLPAGDYTYTVKASGYKAVKGEITLAENRVVGVTLVATKVWDGETKTEPAKIDGVYQISNGAELEWFADYVNAGNKDADAVLTDDIELGDEDVKRVHTPIGNSTNAYNGHFNGAGHSIKYLSASGTTNIGLFGATGADAVIERVTLENANVTGAISVGGIVGLNAGKVYACTVSGTITQNDYKDKGIGGIVGTNSGTVAYCYSSASLVKGHSRDYGYFGGIVGDNSGLVDSCYNLGEIGAAYRVGGIVGGNTGSVKNSFNIGTVPSSKKAAIGNNSGKVENCFYLDTCGASDTNATKKTAAEMKTLASALGGAFKDSSAHPILKWQDAGSKYTITLTVSPENTIVELTRDGETITGTSVDTVYTYEVSAGDYTYSVTPIGGDYVPQKGTISVGYSDVALNVELQIRHYDVVFVLTPADAELVVKKGEETLTPEKDGNYKLPNGTYSYTLSAFGYKTKTAEFTVDHGSVRNTIELDKLNGGNITFAITSDKPFADGQPTITVTHTESGKTFTFVNNEPKFLPDGDYTYIIKAPTYGKLEGGFTINGAAQTITGAMSYSSAWDGETTVEPTLVDGVYQISNGYELAWYRDKVNSSTLRYTVSAVLTADIDLGGNEWTPIFKYTGSSLTGYAATFDGNGHKITGLNVNMTDKGAGLFGNVYKGGIIKNLTVEGTVVGGQYVGGIVAYLGGGKVENCTNNANITSTLKTNAFVGGIVGSMSNYTDKTSYITGCVNNGSINGGENSYVGGIAGQASYGPGIDNCVNNGAVSGKASVGGITGNSSIPISNCSNHGNITATGNSVGGIVGFTNKIVSYCYNTGNVSGKGAAEDGVGGIVGRLHNAYGGSVDSSLNTGVITADSEFYGAIVGTKGKNTSDRVSITNSCYLASSSDKGIGTEQSTDEIVETLTAEEIASPLTAAKLGGKFAYKAGASTPLLDFEDAEAKHVTGFVTDPETAVVTLTKNGAAVAPVSGKLYVLDDGDYSYTVSCSKYDTKSGTLSVAGLSQCVRVTLDKETFDITFDVTPSDAKITITQNGETVASEAPFKLPNGDYSYTVEKFGYKTVTGSFTVADAAVAIPAITLEGYALRTITFAPDLGGASVGYSIKVKSGDTQVAETTGDPITLPDGDYTFSCKAVGFYDYEGKFSVNGGNITVDFKMEVRTTWDGTVSTTAPELVDGVYQIASAEELAWFAKQVNDGNKAINAKLLCDININDEFSSNKWTSIGETYDNQFTGTFDGNGKTVKGLDCSLFGFNGEGSMVKNVTVTGSYIVTEANISNIGGICLTSYGSFENCVNYMEVSTTWQRIGGIVGILYNTGSIKNCANYGHIYSSHNTSEYIKNSYTYLGGIVGYAYGEVSGCANYGKVENTAKSYGGVGGIVGVSESSVSDCYNMGEVRGYARTGGIVGAQNKTGASTTRCYNVGKVVCTNESTSGSPFCGAIAGSITDADGKGIMVAQVTNCWYLENSFYQKRASTIYNGGIGYFGNGADNTVAMTADKMKTDLFAQTLGDAFNAADDGQNDGYPVLKWQGGHTPTVPQDQIDVVNDMNALTIATEVRKATDLVLPTTGSNGSAITWSSANTNVISNGGAVTLPETGSVSVKLTATVSKGEFSETKEFTVNVYSSVLTAKTELDALVGSLSSGQLIAAYGADTNVIDCVKKALANKISGYESFKTVDDITYTISNIGAPMPEGTCGVAEDGTITYFYRDPSASGMKFGYSYITVKLGAKGAESEYKFRLYIPWDRTKVITAMTPALDTITFDTIKGENTSAEQVDKNLVLPTAPENYGWIGLDWNTEQTQIVTISEGIPGYAAGSGVITLPETDTEVSLKAIFKFNLTIDDKEPDITIEKTITFTAKGSAGDRDAEMQRALDSFTLDMLTDFDSGEPIDKDAVTNDIQLPTPRKLGIDGKYYEVATTVTGRSTVEGYHLYANRPLPGEPDEEVELTLTIKHKTTGASKNKVLGTIKVKALTDTEINAELELMNDVKAHFFDAIKGSNKRPDRITGDLHAFREAYRGADGELVYVYNYADDTGNGIKPVDLPKEGYDESYNLFHSSAPSVIKHENLQVNRPAERTTVTITACLSSQKFARYAELYPDDARFAQLSRQIVTIDLTVLAAGEPDSDWRDAYENVMNYLKNSVDPKPGSMYGEWAVLALARSEVKAPAWYLRYTDALKAADLSEFAPNDFQRAVIALTALGVDAKNFTDTDLVQKLIEKRDGKYLSEISGNTSLAFSLIALNTKPYGTEYDAAREDIISLLIANQLDSGAWYINDKNPGEDLDATAMVVTALSKYYDRSNVKSTVDKALDWLASKYSNGFGSSESDSQMIVALTSLGLNPETDTRFGGLVTSLISYADDSGMFRHTKTSTSTSELSTEQAAYALTAYSRFLDGKSSLYDMSGTELLIPSAEVGTLISLIDSLTVSDCSRGTLNGINAIKSLYSELSESDKALVTNYSDFTEKTAEFDRLLDEYKKSCVRKLNAAFEALDSGDYSTKFWKELEKAYRDGLYEINSATCSDDVSSALDKTITALNAKESTLISVTFMLIGDRVHGEGGHDSYEVWIPETGYRLKPDSTVYDLFTRALSDKGLDSEGASGGYVSAIKAPDSFGGFWLGEFDNGSGSGWVYTVNGDYPDVALTDYTLSDGDSVVWSYVDDYKEELPDDMGDDDTKKDDGKKDPTTEEPEPIELPFTDIDGHWSYDNIEKMYALGLMNGVSADHFAPDVTLTRAMFATILWRLAGSEKAETMPFTDVAKNSWYETAVAWCYANGIVNGTSDTTFSPDAEITREQLAAMLIRYAEKTGVKLDKKADLSGYTDSGRISSWAKDSVALAVGNGIMNGRSSTVLDPLGKATRAECAAMVVRFIDLTKTAD